MPFRTMLDHTLNLVIHEGHGLISHEKLRVERTSCFGLSGRTHNPLWDLRDASLKLLTAEQVRTLAEDAKAFAQKKTGKKNAWVATSPVDFGLCRMSEMVAAGAGLDLGVFKDFDKAMDWIKS